MDLFCYLFFVFVMFLCLFIVATWSHAWKGLASWLSCMHDVFCVLSLSHMVSWVRCGA